MSDDLIEKINAIANEQNVSFNQVVVQCCEYAIENIKKSDNKNLTERD